ncbi:hypothetical protein ACFPOB_27225 [Bosea eneae]|uniref:Uncharacterized protein n=1 Tax=Bosea eneae TaxID=151454 RepID=A0ABW0IYK7_9HYPH
MASELTIGQQLVARLGTRRRGVIDFIRSSIDACERDEPQIVKALMDARLADAFAGTGIGRENSEIALANTVSRHLQLHPERRAIAEALLRCEP